MMVNHFFLLIIGCVVFGSISSYFSDFLDFFKVPSSFFKVSVKVLVHGKETIKIPQKAVYLRG